MRSLTAHWYMYLGRDGNWRQTRVFGAICRFQRREVTFWHPSELKLVRYLIK